MSDSLSKTISEIATAFDERRLTARELIEAATARHERWDKRLSAYSQWSPEPARQAAAAADAAFAAGTRVGSLQGIPVSVKDLFGVAGLPTFAGTPRRLPPAWEQEGPLVATVRRELGAIVGKTHMVEFAFGGTGANHHWGCPTNPWSAEAPRSPGGSSSGAGVSLAEGSALIAFGSDTAGSVRIPACATGHVGLKVTAGRWSADGLVPLSRVFDTPGRVEWPLSRVTGNLVDDNGCEFLARRRSGRGPSRPRVDRHAGRDALHRQAAGERGVHRVRHAARRPLRDRGRPAGDRLA